jgi:hypothetical protein
MVLILITDFTKTADGVADKRAFMVLSWYVLLFFL